MSTIEENLLLGIICNYKEINEEKEEDLVYDFSQEQLKILKEKYNLESIAGKGTSFDKAKRILHYFAPKLTHSPWYDNHINCNALDLLEYSFENKEQGINCLNKAKIISECCLSLGIYARRVFIGPFSPFDFDSHVVCEIFDESFDKWIMIDPTTDGYFIDDTKIPLSMLEIRNNFANLKFQTFVKVNGKLLDLTKVKEKNKNINKYFLKNSFLLSFEKYNGFGVKNQTLNLTPKNYSIVKNEKMNIEFRIKNIPEEHKDLLEKMKESAQKAISNIEPNSYFINSIYKKPNK